MAGTPSQAQLLLRSSWESAGVVRNESKAVEGHIVTTNKGALFEGSHGTIGPSPDRLAELGFILLTLCASDEVSQEQLQIALGHVAHCATFRRPLFSCLSAAYRAASEWRSGPLEPIVVDELLTVCSLLAYTFIDAKARLDPQVVCTDASETGGGACLSVGLTPEARDYWLNQLPAQSPQVTQTTTPAPQPATAPRVFLLSLFDGIGGALQALKLLGVSPVAAVIVEPDSFARRVVHQHHNVWQQFSDVADLTDVIIQQWGSSYADVVDVALVVAGFAGFPCQELSSLKGLAARGLSHSLFHQAVRVCQLLESAFPNKVLRLFENVASMPAASRDEISLTLSMVPWRIDPHSISHCRRPRLYWLDAVVPSAPDMHAHSETNVTHVEFLGARPSLAQMLAPGASVHPTFNGFATFTRPRPRTSAGPSPAGIARCSPRAKHMWEANMFRYQPYQYEQCFLVYDAQGFYRPPCATEREACLGFPVHYTQRMLGKQALPDSCYTEEDLRCNALGNSFSVVVIARLLAVLLQLDVTVDQLWARWEKSDDFQVPFRGNDRTLVRASATTRTLLQHPLPQSPEALAVYAYMRMADPRGADIRLLPGHLYQPRAWPRHPIPTSQWIWSQIQSYSFTHAQHINLLEERAWFNYLRRRALQNSSFRTRFLSVFDSQVVAAVNTKSRSSSLQLNRLLRRCSGLLLACGFWPLTGWCRSEMNPADRPSRRNE
eukprot:6491246-Amphidinium_carterae.1